MINERGVRMLDRLIPCVSDLDELIKACWIDSWNIYHPVTHYDFQGYYLYGCEDRLDIYEEVRKLRQDTFQQYMRGSTKAYG
jgi:hypothetical protein